MDIHALPNLSKADLDHMFDGLGEVDWKYFAGKRLFFTGGTGFIGGGFKDEVQRLNN